METDARETVKGLPTTC